jgi:phosphohistidine phosphatase
METLLAYFLAMPKLFLIRHAIAEDREDFKKTGLPDSQRPLTKEGQRKMYKIAEKLFLLEPQIEEFYQSPLLRSQQTVQALQKFYTRASIQTLNSLDPETPVENLMNDLQRLSLDKDRALVGHEDHISQFFAYLITGQFNTQSKNRAFAFKKGGIACLEYKKARAGQFQLKWFVTPKIFLD